MMANGDGKFFWYYGPGRQPDTYYGQLATRQEALCAAWTDYEDGDFTIVEADKCVPSFDCFDADHVIERYEEHNEECWGEDGADIVIKSVQARELERELADVLRNWMDRHSLRGNLWNFGEMRNEEYVSRQSRPTLAVSDAES